MALKELKEELNNSKRDCADKDEVIRSITSQRHEIQENLDEALEQVCLLIWLLFFFGKRYCFTSRFIYLDSAFRAM